MIKKLRASLALLKHCVCSPLGTAKWKVFRASWRDSQSWVIRRFTYTTISDMSIDLSPWILSYVRDPDHNWYQPVTSLFVPQSRLNAPRFFPAKSWKFHHSQGYPFKSVSPTYSCVHLLIWSVEQNSNGRDGKATRAANCSDLRQLWYLTLAWYIACLGILPGLCWRALRSPHLITAFFLVANKTVKVGKAG